MKGSMRRGGAKVLAKCMDQASRDCIQEGKRHKFPVFTQEQEPEERTGRRIRRDSFEEDSDSEDEEFDESPATSEFHEEEAATEDSPKYVVSTRLYYIARSTSKRLKICL